VNDSYSSEVVPFKMNKYLSVLHEVNDEREGIFGFLCVYKVKASKKAQRSILESKEKPKDDSSSNIEIVDAKDVNSIQRVLLECRNAKG